MNNFFLTHTHTWYKKFTTNKMRRKFLFKKRVCNKILHTILKLILNIRLFIHVFYTHTFFSYIRWYYYIATLYVHNTIHLTHGYGHYYIPKPTTSTHCYSWLYTNQQVTMDHEKRDEISNGQKCEVEWALTVVNFF